MRCKLTRDVRAVSTFFGVSKQKRQMRLVAEQRALSLAAAAHLHGSREGVPDALAANDLAGYTHADGRRRVARVVCVHRDDSTPYYTILLDGHERSTEARKLIPLPTHGRV